MTQHRLIRVAAAVVGLLLSTGVVAAQMAATPLRDGTLFYVLAVAPRDRASAYAGTFRRVVESIEIMDGDPCVR